MARLLAGELLLIFLAIVVQGQQHTKSATPRSTEAGSVNGRVLGITQTGDLKPARMPRVYLLYQGLGDHHCVNDVCEKTADRQYQVFSLTAGIKRDKATTAEYLHDQDAGDENRECREDLLDTDRALLSVSQWALDNKKARQVLTTDGDEAGYFSIAKVPTGHYRVIARGQAGANDAYWELWVTVKSGTATAVKLMKPGKSCINLE